MDGGVIVARCLNDGRAVIDGCDFAFCFSTGNPPKAKSRVTSAFVTYSVTYCVDDSYRVAVKE